MKRFLCLLFSGALGCTATVDGSPDGAAAGAGMATGGSSPTGGGGMGAEGGVAVIPGGVSLEGKPVYYRVVRLTHAQWENAARVLLKLPEAPGLSSGFTPDPPDGKFSNNERKLYMTGSLWTDYRRAAEALAEQVAGDPAALARLDGNGDATTFIRSLCRAAFRRAPRGDEEARYAALFAKGPMFYGSGQAFTDGARLVIEAVLQSPSFLYRIELTPKGSRLSGEELASKLAFLFRDSAPDTELLAKAESGALADQQQLLESARQMLNEDTARRMVERFHSQLFGLHRYRSILKDTTLFPEYSEGLNSTLEQADLRFFDRLFQSDKGVREILTSPLAFVNAQTAPFYGLTATGSELSEVMLDDSRPGFLTRVGFLAYNAGLVDPDPIHRGVDISNRILCGHLEPPAGEIPPLPPFMPGQTNRERVAAHTGEGFCGGCHNAIINPLGFAFEGFDAMGKARAMDNGKPVDASGSYSFSEGIKSFANAAELSRHLSESQQAHGCYQANLAEFALARDVAGGDGALVTELQKKSLSERLSIRESLLSLVQSKEFTTATGGTP